MGTGGAGGDFSVPRWDQHPPDPRRAWKSHLKALGIPEENTLAVKNQELGKGGRPRVKPSQGSPTLRRKRRNLGILGGWGKSGVRGGGAGKVLETRNWLRGRKKGVKSRERDLRRQG